MNLGLFLSRAPADLRLSQTHIGVRFLQVSCGTAPCAPDQAIYQDLPVASLPPSSSYDYGLSGIIDGTQNGTMTVRLCELIETGNNSGAPPSMRRFRRITAQLEPSDSVYNGSLVFLNTSPPVALKPGAVALRFSLSPRMPVLYDIIDAWLMPR